MAKYLIGKDWQTLLLAHRLAELCPEEEITVFKPSGYPIPWGLPLPDRVERGGVPLQGNVLFQGERLKLPLSMGSVIPQVSSKRSSLRSLFSARLQVKSSELTGQGIEERTFKDWVERRFGAQLHRVFFEPFLEGALQGDVPTDRSGSPFFPSVEQPFSAGLGRSLFLNKRSEAREIFFPNENDFKAQIIEVGGYHRLKKNERVWVLEAHQHDLEPQSINTFKLDGELFIDLSPQEAGLLLTEMLPKTLAIDLRYVQSHLQRSALFTASVPSGQIFFATGKSGLVRAHAIGADRIWVDYASCGQTELDIQRLTSQLMLPIGTLKEPLFTSEKEVPLWKQQSHFRFRRWVDYIDELKLNLIGCRGLFFNTSISHQGELLERLISGISNAELVRLYVEPSVKIKGRQPQLEDFLP